MTWSNHPGGVYPGVAIFLPPGSQHGHILEGLINDSIDAMHFYRLFTYIYFLGIADKDEQYIACVTISAILDDLYEIG